MNVLPSCHSTRLLLTSAFVPFRRYVVPASTCRVALASLFCVSLCSLLSMRSLRMSFRNEKKWIQHYVGSMSTALWIWNLLRNRLTEIQPREKEVGSLEFRIFTHGPSRSQYLLSFLPPSRRFSASCIAPRSVISVERLQNLPMEDAGSANNGNLHRTRVSGMNEYQNHHQRSRIVNFITPFPTPHFSKWY